MQYTKQEWIRAPKDNESNQQLGMNQIGLWVRIWLCKRVFKNPAHPFGTREFVEPEWGGQGP
jgi:hypothetical protein